MEQTKIEQNLNLFRELISCQANVYLWEYDSKGTLQKSNCPHESIFDTLFTVFDCKAQMCAHAEPSFMPLQIDTPAGLLWLAGFQKDQGVLNRVYVIGPVFGTDSPLSVIQQVIEHNPQLRLHTDAAWRKEFREALKELPTLNTMIWTQYGIMLHYCLTEEKILPSDLSRTGERIVLPDGTHVQKNRHRTWLLEQDLMRAVREGDLNYREALDRSSLVSSGVPVHASDPVRHAKDSVIVSIALCTRAAIDGGLSPEQAYSLGDTYIQAVEDARSFLDIAGIHDTMMEDFVLRVHKKRGNPSLSGYIQTCCDYIEGHLEQELNIEILSQLVGYSKYYLSRQFKEEMHVSVNQYIKLVRIERAKSLLLTTEESILEIALRLKFCSRSHFSESFREIEGCTPVEFREKYGKRNP